MLMHRSSRSGLSNLGFNKIRKTFYKFYHRHSKLIVKYIIGLKTLLQQDISVPIFYGGLVQPACLVLNPTTVSSYGFLFNCTTVGQASDSMMALTLSFNWLVGA